MSISDLIKRGKYQVGKQLHVNGGTTPYPAKVHNLRCPYCGKEGAFHGFEKATDITWQQSEKDATGRTFAYNIFIGMRQCPNMECRGVVFVSSRDGILKDTYPAEVLDFDSSSLPEGVKSCLEEAVKCHAHGCYKASALMVRRTLEELCAEQGATGGNLEKRIEALQDKIVIPGALFTAMHELRFLGNDAAHIEAREYDEVGEPQTRIAIRLTQEFLKATYQLGDLLSELKSLKGDA